MNCPKCDIEAENVTTFTDYNRKWYCHECGIFFEKKDFFKYKKIREGDVELEIPIEIK